MEYKDKIAEIETIFGEKFNNIKTLEDLCSLKILFLGKKGLLTEQTDKIRSIEPSNRRDFGARINSLKKYIESKIDVLYKNLHLEEMTKSISNDRIDVTLPGRPSKKGKIHPIAHTINEVRKIFFSMGFASIDGPEIEDDWHNFTALNIGEHHPARQSHDTFYIKNHEKKLLRTHTSSVQIRHLQANKPPVKVFSIGKVYSADFDATHTPMFHQIEGICIDKNINISHLKWCLQNFLRGYFELENVPMRLRPSYFPFTEPSIEIDIQCDKKHKDGIKIGTGKDWLEILGCGMLHKNVLKNVGIDASEFQGFAFGCGIERLCMLKHGISDIRNFFNNDIRWLDSTGF